MVLSGRFGGTPVPTSASAEIASGETSTVAKSEHVTKQRAPTHRRLLRYSLDTSMSSSLAELPV